MTAYWLSIHADFACRHSGACCTSGWPIPVEASRLSHLEDAVARGVLAAPNGAFASTPALGGGIGAVLNASPEGACVFFDAALRENRCAVQRELGHGALPASCRHFPRVCLTDPRGVSVTLSHYCSTAAGMLFRSDRPLEIVSGPEPVPGEDPEGLDAREGWPPLLSPSVLMDLGAYARWERLAVAIFADDEATAEEAVDSVAAAAERLRSWTPGGATLEAAVAALEREHERRSRTDGRSRPLEPDLESFDEVVGCVPSPNFWDPAPAGIGAAWNRFAEGGWAGFSRPLRFYLASKVFASWVAYQGQGLRTIVRSLRAALCVVKVEALRLAARGGTLGDAELLREAIRRADLLLVHLADREALARAWSRADRPGRLRPRPVA